MSSCSHHRLALGGVSLLAAAALGLSASGAGTARADVPRGSGGPPNIILIQADDQTLSQFTSKVMPRTTHLLASGGTSFSQYSAATAQCCPSRASLITGQYAHNDGVSSNGVGYPGLIDKDNVLPVWLQQAGYLTMHVGKFMNRYEYFAHPASVVPPGWDQWYSLLGGTHYYDYDLYENGGVVHRGSKRGANSNEVATNKALQLIRDWASKAVPIYLQLDLPAPHVAAQGDPFGKCGRAAIPAARDEGSFADARTPRPPSFNEDDMRDKPAFLSAAPKLGGAQKSKVRRRWRCALASLKGVDRAVGQVHNAIQRAGLLSRTVFLYVSDNGQFYGEHRIAKGKVLPYQEAVHLPLVIKSPRRYLNGKRPPGHVRKPVANIDLAPTILSFADAEPCPPSGPCRTMDGRSLKPLLKGSRKWPRHRGLLNEYSSPNPGNYATCRFAGILTRETIYVQHSQVVDPTTGQCVPSDEVERYDLGLDPFELHNMCFAGDLDNCPQDRVQSDLESRLSRLRDCAGVRGRDERVGGRAFCE